MGNKESSEAYQLLADLAVGDEIIPQEFTFGHRLTLPSVTSVSELSLDVALTQEICVIQSALKTLQFMKRKKVFDFIAIPPQMDAEGPVADSLQKVVSEVLRTFPTTDIGIDLTTEFMHVATSAQILQVLDLVLNLLSKEGRAMHVLVATNALTVMSAAMVYEWARGRNQASFT